MKKFNQVKITLFDSTIAQFKLSIEALFTRPRQDGSISNLAYITDKGVAMLNPSIYLVFSYKSATFGENKNLYTSYPQLFKIRKALEQVKDYLEDNKGFISINGVLTVRPDLKDPVLISNIGKSDKWMSISLAAIDFESENQTIVKIPGVTLQLSDSEYASVLTAEEILTIYSIVKDIDLTSVQVQLSTMFMAAEEELVMMYPQYPQYTQPVQQPQYAQQQPVQQPQYAQQQPVQQPQYAQQQPVRQQPTTARYNNSPTRQAPVSRQAPQVVNQQPTTQQSAGLPPRKSEKSIINIKAVEETPISQINFNDDKATSDIFNDEN